MATLKIRYDTNNDGLLEYGDTQGKTGEMKIIVDAINHYITANDIQAEKIIILAGDASDDTVAGATNFGGKFAWIFTNDVHYAITNVIPHEYGHAKFGKADEAPFQDNPYKDGSLWFGSGITDEQRRDPRWDKDNLMGYGDGNKLRVWQWNKINSVIHKKN